MIASLRKSSLFAVGMLALLIVGCGKPAAPSGTVKGKVLLDDQPYAKANVVLMSLQSGQSGSAPAQSDGTFELKAPIPVGAYKVFLTPKQDDNAEPKPEGESIDKSVPKKYWNETTTDISVEIKEGPNEVAVPLKSR